MNPFMSKNSTADALSLQRIFSGHKTEPDESLSPSPSRYYKSPNSGGKPISLGEHARSRPLETEPSTEADLLPLRSARSSSINRNEETFSHEVYRDLLGENRKLVSEIMLCKQREKESQTQIATLEGEKNLLIGALEQAQRKLYEISTKAKDDKKRMNIIIDTFKQSLHTLTKPTSNKESQTIEDYFGLTRTMTTSNSDLNEDVNKIFKKLEQINCSQEIVDENEKLQKEVQEFKKYIETLQNYIQHMKTQSKKQDEIQTELIDKGKGLFKENLNFKIFIRSLTEKTKFDQYNSDEVRDEANPPSSSRITVQIIPSYMKALSLSMTDKDK